MDPITSTARTICHPTAEPGARDSEPIFELAEECESLFTKHIAKLDDLEEKNGAKVVLEIYQRFTAWGASLGVFEALQLSLNDNVRHHFDIKDQFLRLLDILQRNLTYLFEPDQSPEHMDIDSVDGDWLLSSNPKLSISSLEAISGAVDRLHTLGNLIQRSSLVSQSTKVRESAGNLHLKSFEKVAYLSLQALYGSSSQSLLEQLAESMAEMYARILERKQHQALNAYRPRLHVLDPLYLTLKNYSIGITSYEEDLSTRMLNTTPGPADIPPSSESEQAGLEPHFSTDPGHSYLPKAGLSNWTTRDTAPVRVTRARRLMTMGELARSKALRAADGACQDCHRKKKRCHHRLGSQEFGFKLESPWNHSLKSGINSILENLTEYPRLPKGSLACDWCSSIVATDTMDEVLWRQHVNQDNEPYICLSEMCSESLPKFWNSTEWLQHMLDIHGQNWHQEVHPPSLWICPLCTEEQVSFSKSNDLEIHFETVHPTIFTKYQAQAIIQHSRIPTSRQQESCPICCLPIKDGDDYQFSQNNATYNKMFAKNLPKDTSSSRASSLGKIGSHVAVHLESIMVLTLRLISINSAEDDSNDNKSKSNTVDVGLSWLRPWMDSDNAGVGESIGFPQSFNDEISMENNQEISSSIWNTQRIYPFLLPLSHGHASEEMGSDTKLELGTQQSQDALDVTPNNDAEFSGPKRSVAAGRGLEITEDHASSWSYHDDQVLFTARARGQGWSQIQKEHFQNKTANACRKRHERLVAKRRGTEWNPEMLEKLSTEYSRRREQIWQPLANAIGEKWQDVEKACFEKGLKSLITQTRPRKGRNVLHTQVQPSSISKPNNDEYPRRTSLLPLKDILAPD